MNKELFSKTGLACAISLLVSTNAVNAADCFGQLGYCLTDGNAQFQINEFAEMELLVNGVQHVWTTDFVVAEITPDPLSSPYPLGMYDYIDFNQAPAGNYSTLNLTNMSLSNWGTVNTTFQLIGGAIQDSARLVQSFTVTNNSAASQQIYLYAYTDVDVGGTFASAGDDLGELVSFDANGFPTAYRQYDDTHELITTLNIRPDYYEVSLGTGCILDLCEDIYYGIHTILSNTVTNLMGDLNQAGQYVRTLLPGESFSYTQTMDLAALTVVPVETDNDKDGIANNVDLDPNDVFVPYSEGVNLSHTAIFDDPLSSDVDFISTEVLRVHAWSSSVGVGASATYSLTGGTTVLTGAMMDNGDGTYSAAIPLVNLNYLGNDVVLDINMKKKKWNYNASKIINVAFDANTAPVVNITTPVDGSTFASGTIITFNCLALDAEDGDLSADCTWTSSLDRNLGKGAAITASLSDGIHTVTSTITDSNNRVSADSIKVIVGVPIVLTGNGYKVKGAHTIDLSWINANGALVDIIRNGDLVATVNNVGAYTDTINTKGGATYHYSVCEEGTSDCSEDIIVVF